MGVICLFVGIIIAVLYVFATKVVNQMPKYGKKAQEKVRKVMHEFKKGRLKNGRSEKPVKSRKQAIAIGLSEARESGAKVPEPD